MSGDPLSVLVIDDEPIVLGVAEACLERLGWRVHAASDPRMGLALAHECRPDVILCDLTMPGVSGIEVIRTLKADPQTAAMPIVLMSGLATNADFPNAALAGFLQKPFGAAELRRAVEHAAGQDPPE